MKRAAELFALGRRASASPYLDEIWWTRSAPAASFLSVAAPHWEIVVTRQRDVPRVTVRGPETKATLVPIPEDAEFFGIQFSLGTFMPDLPPTGLVDRALTLPVTTPTSFWFGGAEREIPHPGNADSLVAALVRDGRLVHDAVASAALQGDVGSLSTRSIERRTRRATGLPRGTIRQIRRAEQAVELLSRGFPAADVAPQAGYADQSHLSRSLKRFVGVTPSRIEPPGRG